MERIPLELAELPATKEEREATRNRVKLFRVHHPRVLAAAIGLAVGLFALVALLVVSALLGSEPSWFAFLIFAVVFPIEFSLMWYFEDPRE